ncbi:MAG: NADP-dependent malic enzyme [Proteobacteria bacterium]|nr:NADP-dependent malic enzyme [Pseudomonadota bacterium]MDA1308757.1 NADP-dependent malic enzyme [Pseudomonadota bacterium]
MDDAKRQTDQDALDFHALGKPGKFEISPTKPLNTQRDLSLAYSPGVAVPCLEIEKDPSKAYDYTAKGNVVAVISNGTAVLGLGNIGALAAKPVMEGKAVLFKKFADIDGIDLEVNTENVDEVVNCVRFLGKSFGGINLEDIKAPECFIIEQRLKELLDIPVFHDDQHGTALIAAAGLINALYLTERDLKTTKLVVNGAGAASIAGIELIKAMGVPHENVIMCDSRGVVYQGREAGMNQWKSAHAIETDARTLAEAMVGADVVLGLSVKGAISQDMVKSMADNPIIFAMANPDPEITPEEVAAIRPDAIMATGRSDYPNQVNNVLGFPYVFRGALDVRASEINDAMKIAASNAIAELAREDVPDEVSAAYGRPLQFGREYIIPAPFDPRLIVKVSSAVARAAMESGVAARPITDFQAYEAVLRARLNPTANALSGIHARVRQAPKRVVFAEGEEERVIRAAIAFRAAGYGEPILIGREDAVRETMARLGISASAELEIHNARLSAHNQEYANNLYKRLQRQGHLFRDVQRMVNQDRNVFGASMVAHGHADAMVTGVTRSFGVNHEYITRVLDPKPGHRLMTCSVVITRSSTLFIADTNINELPGPEALADIAIQTAERARAFGHEPRVALLSFSNFGYPRREHMQRIRDGVRALDERNVDFEYDGEMNVDVALDMSLRANYPFCRLSGPANVLIMPALHSANISYKLLRAVGGGTIIGPMLIGLEKSVQIVPMNATVNDLVEAAAIAAYDAVIG